MMAPARVALGDAGRWGRRLWKRLAVRAGVRQMRSTRSKGTARAGCLEAGFLGSRRGLKGVWRRAWVRRVVAARRWVSRVRASSLVWGAARRVRSRAARAAASVVASFARRRRVAMVSRASTASSARGCVARAQSSRRVRLWIAQRVSGSSSEWRRSWSASSWAGVRAGERVADGAGVGPAGRGSAARGPAETWCGSAWMSCRDAIMRGMVRIGWGSARGFGGSGGKMRTCLISVGQSVLNLHACSRTACTRADAWPSRS